MTIKELEEYRALIAEIDALNKQIESLYNTYHSPSNNDGGNSKGSSKSPVEKALTRIQSLEQVYLDRIKDLQEQAHRIEKWVSQIEDPFIRSCIRYHYLLGYSWSNTSKKMYGYTSYYNARKAVFRFMGKEK